MKPSKHAGLLMQVEVDLDMNAHANARAWHGDRKARTVKQQKTIEANTKALAVADKKVQIQLSKVMLSAPSYCRILRASGRLSLSICPTHPAANS